MTLLDASRESQSWQERVTAAGAAALLAAAAAALVGVWLSPGPAENWPAAAGIALAYVAAVLAVAGATGWWRLNVPERVRSPEARKLLAGLVAVAAWMVPAAILGARGAWIALPAAALFGVLSARAFAAADAALESPETSEPPAVETLRMLALSPDASRPRIGAQAGSALAYGAAVVALLGWYTIAAVMTAVACAVITGLAVRANRRQRGRRPAASAAMGIGLAILLTATAFLPGGAGGPPAVSGPERIAAAAALASKYRYPGVVLLADPPREPALKAPPSRRPSSDALRKYGSPLALAYTWIGRGDLNMQARQTLAEPMDVGCCTAIDVVLRGREDRPGSVHLGVYLATAGEEGGVSLGVQPLPASESSWTTVSYALPQDGSLGSFDQIMVYFHLADDLRRSPNLAIQRFDLVP